MLEPNNSSGRWLKMQNGDQNRIHPFILTAVFYPFSKGFKKEVTLERTDKVQGCTDSGYCLSLSLCIWALNDITF